jgi:hypothetical protein
MRHYKWIAGAVLALTLATTTAPLAQLPGGMQLPGAISKDALLAQAKQVLADLTSMKSSAALQPAQAAQVDTLLPKAQSLTGELEQPQLDAARLPALAGNLSDLQKQVGVLKGFMR